MLKRSRRTHPRPAIVWLLRTTRLAALLVCSAVAAGPASAQEPAVALSRWMANGSPRFRSHEGVILLSKSAGWLASDAYFVDVALQLEFRAVEPGSEGAVLVRAWEAFERQSGYRVALADPAEGSSRVGTVARRENRRLVQGQGGRALAPRASSGPAGEWHRLDVRCQHDRVTVALDGTTINEVDGSEPLAGQVGLEVARGAFEFRRIAARQLPGGVFSCRDRPVRESGHPLALTRGVTVARLLYEEKPRYSLGAMRRLVQGTVTLDAVVGIDGTVQAVCVVRSIDPELDAEAVGAARRWRFRTGEREGSPVPVVVTLELSYTLK